MDRFSTRAWGPEPPRGTPRVSWFVDMPPTAEERAPPRPSWRDPRYDIMPYGTAAEAEDVADTYMGTVDERRTFNPNTHPEYKRWLEHNARSANILAAAEAKWAAAADVDYDLEGRAFGVPRAKPGTTLRLYQEYDASLGGVVPPDRAKSFYYAVDAVTGAPTRGDADGWAPHGKAAELDDFATRATRDWSVAPQLVKPTDWSFRDAVVAPSLAHDAASRLLEAGSAHLVDAMRQRTAARVAAPEPEPRTVGHVAPDFVGRRDAMRLSKGGSTVARPSGSTIQHVGTMNAASAETGAAYLRDQADAAAALAALRARTQTPDGFVVCTDDERRTTACEPVSAAQEFEIRACTEHDDAARCLPWSALERVRALYKRDTLANSHIPHQLYPPIQTQTPPPPPPPSTAQRLVNSLRGALYDAAHWSELPTAADGVLPTLTFVTTRDNRGPYLAAWLGMLLLLAVALAVAVSAARRSKSAQPSVPLWMAALAAGNPQLAAASYAAAAT